MLHYRRITGNVSSVRVSPRNQQKMTYSGAIGDKGTHVREMEQE